MIWHEVKKERPPSGRDVLLVLNDGSVHEGRYLKNANQYVRDVDKFKIYKQGKYIDSSEVIMWREIPRMGAVYG